MQGSPNLTPLGIHGVSVLVVGFRLGLRGLTKPDDNCRNANGESLLWGLQVGFAVVVGYPLLNLEGVLSSKFILQYSTNLAGTNWINLLSLTNLPSSPYLFLDPAGDGEPARFYRAFMQ